MLNGAGLPKSLPGKITATVVFILNRPPSKTIGGDTSYNRMFSKHVDLFFLCTIGTRLHGDHQPHLTNQVDVFAKHPVVRRVTTDGLAWRTVE